MSAEGEGLHSGDREKGHQVRNVATSRCYKGRKHVPSASRRNTAL
jgi:hypothetical protein